MPQIIVLFFAFLSMPTWAQTVCEIKIGSCPAHPYWNSYFTKATWSWQWMSYTYPSYDDTYNDSHMHADRCLARAEQWHRWCQAPASQPATATFASISDDGDRNTVASASFPSGNTCAITLQGTCKSYSTLPRYWIDNWAPAHSSAQACQQRAHDYYYFCGTSATARYHENYRPGPSFTVTTSGQFTCGPYESFYELDIDPDQGKTLTYDYFSYTDSHYVTYSNGSSSMRLMSAPGVLNINFLPAHMNHYGIRKYTLRFCGGYGNFFARSINSQLQILY